MKRSLLSFRALLIVLLTLFTGSTWADDVTYDFSNSDNYPTGFPVKAGTALTTETDFTLANAGTFSLLNANSGSYYMATSSGAKVLFFGKTIKFTNMSETCYLKFPGKSGYKITKVVITNGSGASKDVSTNIFNSKATEVSTAVSTTAGGTMSFNISDLGDNEACYFTASKTQAAGKNFQISKAVITYTSSSVVIAKVPSLTTTGVFFTAPYDVTITNNESGSTVYYTTDGTNPTTSSESFTEASKTIQISATTTIKAMSVASGKENSSVVSATYTKAPVYNSLAELAAVEPTKDGTPAGVVLDNEKIDSIYVTNSGAHNGIFLHSGNQVIEIYCTGVPAAWEARGSVTGTVTGTWKVYNGVWELCPDDWKQLTYTAPPANFTATDKNGKEINNKFAVSPLTVKYNYYEDGMTVKVNGTDATYDATTGLTITSKIGSKANDKYTVAVYAANGDSITSQTYIWIPTATSVSTLKGYADGTEAILSMSAANVTYATSDGKSAYIQDATRGIYAYNLNLGFTAYKQANVNIWGKKTTYNNVAEFAVADSTAKYSSVTASTTAVTPTAKTVVQTLLPDNQLTYVKISGAKIVKKSSSYYAVCGTDSVLFYDSFKTNLLTSLTTVPCFADVTCITSMDKNGTYEIFPIAIDNISDKIKGTCGTVDWTIDMDGNMEFFPTNGVSGTLAALGIADSKRPWAAYVTLVKTVKFTTGTTAAKGIAKAETLASPVNTAADPSYMFKNMANLESVDFTNFNTSAATTLKGFFQNCSSIKSIDISDLDLANVTNFQQTFDACKSLENVDFGENDLNAATNFNTMFNNCAALKEANLGDVNPKAVTDVTSMFFGCAALDKVDLRALNTSHVTSATKMKNFFGTETPSTLILSKYFGKIGDADGSYIALPARDYMSQADNTKAFKLATGTLADEQTALYAYNESLEDYGTYVPYVAPLATATFEETTLESESVKQAATEAGFATFTSGGYTFQNYLQDYGDYGKYYYAFTLTDKTTTTGTDSSNPYESACGGAKSDNNYVVWYDNSYNGGDTITLARPSAITGFYVSNTTYTENVIINGNGYGRKLDKEGDNLILHIYGYDEDGNSTGTVNYTLASTTGNKLSYVKDWRWVDLSSLGATTKYLKFSMTGTDTGDWGLNTPTYFAMDDLGGVAPTTDADLAVYEWPTTGINNANVTTDNSTRKYVVNGKVIIVKNGNKYNVAGALLK